LTIHHPIRVLHVTSVEADNYFLNNLVQYSHEGAVKYYAVTLGRPGGFTDGLRQRGVPTWALDALARPRYPRALIQLARIIHRQGIELVHTHLFDPTLLGALVGKLGRRKVIVTRHHSDAIHTIASRVKRSSYLALESFINHAASHIVAPSQMVRSILTDREGVDPEKVSLIPYGQTLDRYVSVTPEATAKLRAQLGLVGTFMIVNVSRLFPGKGHKFLFDAFARFRRDEPRAKLVLVGNGPIEADLKANVRQLHIDDQVLFLGWRPDALVVTGAADMVVHPSLSEALSSAVIEALSLARPTVATDVSGIRDLLGESERGYRVPIADVDALYNSMHRAWACPGEAQARAIAARQFVAEYLDARKVSKAYVELYRRITKRSRNDS
jgi:glycosyltransferase involved in cell wall biosynthesis